MKRLLNISLLAILFLTPVVAESFNWKAFSNDELLIIRDEIDSELNQRSISKEIKLVSGVYIVGKAIPSGSYIITSLEIFEEDDNEYTEITVYKTEDDHKNRRSFDRIHFGYSFNKPYFLYLEEGYVVDIYDGGIVMKPQY